MQLQNAGGRFDAAGIKLAAISYDSRAILKEFAQQHNIQFPLLADPDSKTIRSFGVLNTEATGMTKGMALPGFLYIDKSGVVREKFFESNYTNRFTPNNVLAKLFSELTEQVTPNVVGPHFELALLQSDQSVVPGSRVSLIAQIQLRPDVHVYAPGVTGYKPIRLTVRPSPEIALASLQYPRSKTVYLEAIKEQVPVFEGQFRIIQDVTVSASKAFVGSLAPQGTAVTINGELEYQACNKTICYQPAALPVQWQLRVLPLNRTRSSDAIQHK